METLYSVGVVLSAETICAGMVIGSNHDQTSNPPKFKHVVKVLSVDASTTNYDRNFEFKFTGQVIEDHSADFDPNWLDNEDYDFKPNDEDYDEEPMIVGSTHEMCIYGAKHPLNAFWHVATPIGE